MDISAIAPMYASLISPTYGKMTAYLMPGPMPTEMPPLADLINNSLGVAYVGATSHGSSSQPLIRMSARDEPNFTTIGYWPGASYTASTGDKFVVPKSATLNMPLLAKLDTALKSWIFMQLQGSHRLDYDKTAQGLYVQGSPQTTVSTIASSGDYIEYDFGAPVALTSIILRSPRLSAGSPTALYNLQALVNGTWQDLAGDIAGNVTESVNPVAVTTSKIRYVFKTIGSSSITYGVNIHFKGDYLPAVAQDATRTIGYIALAPCNYITPLGGAAQGYNLLLDQLIGSAILGREYFGLGFEVGYTLAASKEVFIPGAVTRNGSADVRPQSWIVSLLTVKGAAL